MASWRGVYGAVAKGAGIMSTAAEHMERLQSALADASVQAERLHRLLSSLWDEVGHPTLLALPAARHLLQRSLDAAATAGEELGAEIGDIRWTVVVALLHRASTCVPEATSWEASQITGLLDRLRTRVVQLRNARSSLALRVS